MRPRLATRRRAADAATRAAAHALAAFLALVCARAAAAPPMLRVQNVEIVDQRGFERPMLAATMMVPAGWTTRADVLWQSAVRCAKPFQKRLSAQAPDGSAGLELMPGEGWAASSLGPAGDQCPLGRHADAQAYLRDWVQRHRPGARWLDYRPRPERSRPGLQQSMPGGGFVRSRVETGQALIAYRRDGRELRETLAVSIHFTQTHMPGLPGMPPLQSLFGEAQGVLAVRAPEGELDFRTFDALWQTLRDAPQWSARVNQGLNQMAQDNIATQRKIGEIQAETGRQTLAEVARRGEMLTRNRAEIADIHAATQRDRDATGERMHTQTVRGIREVQPYSDPAGGVVELPSHYRHAWKLRDGSYVLTDAADFHPGRDLGVEGEALRPAP